MSVVQIPLVKGQGKSIKNADYLDLLPTNILPVTRQTEGANGYFRFYPGIDKSLDVDGVSRGVHYNTYKESVYRVMGGKLYNQGNEAGDVDGNKRVSMASSRVSQAVAANNTLKMYRYDGDVKEISNHPKEEVFPGFDKTLYEKTHNPDGDNLTLSVEDVQGELTLTVTPINGNNKANVPISLKESEWSTGKSQTAPAKGTPYITDLKVQGVKFPGGTITVVYTFNPNPVGQDATDAEKKDISKIKWDQHVADTVVPNPQYDWGDVGDVTRHRGRYVFAQKGTDTFWCTDIEDESLIEKDAPAYRAETQPDGILAVRSWRDYVLCFGGSTIEYFRLTGNAANLFQSQPSYMVPVGIAGQFAITEFMDTFAFITNNSSGQHQIAIMGQGNYSVISDYHVNNLLEKYTSAQLSEVVLESYKFDKHDLLVLHLPEETIVYDGAGGMWSLIKTGLYDGVHRAVDYWNESGKITCGDKFSALQGVLSDTKSSQYDEDQEIILYTPLLMAEKRKAHDLEITANTGLASRAQSIFLSATEDGVIWGQEWGLEYDDRFEWLKRSLYEYIGFIEYKVGFKLRIVGSDPATLSNLRVRVE